MIARLAITEKDSGRSFGTIELTSSGGPRYKWTWTGAPGGDLAGTWRWVNDTNNATYPGFRIVMQPYGSGDQGVLYGGHIMWNDSGNDEPDTPWFTVGTSHGPGYDFDYVDIEWQALVYVP